MCQLSFKWVSRVFKRSLMGVKKGFKGVSRIFQGNSKGVSTEIDDSRGL